MESENAGLRALIKQVLSENFGALEEMQKGRQFDGAVSFTLSQLSPDIPEGAYDSDFIMKEVHRMLKAKLDQIFLSTFIVPNFYVIRLGNFIIKTNDGEQPLSFIKRGEADKRYSYPYLYVFHDKAEWLRFGSRFFETDELVIKAAQQYIMDRGLHLVTKTEKGELILFNDFDTDNVIDLVDYSKIKRPEEPKKDRSPVKKKAYIAGQPFMHKQYGKGRIVKTKKHGVDENGNTIYNVTVDFNGEEKTFRLSTAPSTPKHSQ